MPSALPSCKIVNRSGFKNGGVLPDNVSRNLLELNAPDDRGIDAIRNKVKEFARTASYGGVPFKIVCLDEADSLTSAAQHALRRTMERYVETSRFALICNYSSKLIEPIQSRCAIFRFRPIDEVSMKEFLIQICDKEGLVYDAEGMKVVCLPSLDAINDVALGATVTVANLDTLTATSNADA